MSLPQLLRKTAARYQQAVERVLVTWSADCGCERPGSHPQCEGCPCFPVFENLVRSEIQILIQQEADTTSL